MAQNKAGLFALINANLPDNTTQLITPTKHREVSTQVADSALNTLEATAQTVAGEVNFTGGIKKSGVPILTGGSVVEILRAYSAVSQSPTALGSPITLTFGAAIGTGASIVQMSAGGILTFNQPGTYAVRIKLQVGRSGSSGTSVLVTRLMKGATQVGVSDSTLVANADSSEVKESRVAITALAGDTMSVQLARDPTGANFGGVVAFQPTGALSGWTVAASTLMVVEMFSGAV